MDACQSTHDVVRGAPLKKCVAGCVRVVALFLLFTLIEGAFDSIASALVIFNFNNFILDEGGFSHLTNIALFYLQQFDVAFNLMKGGF